MGDLAQSLIQKYFGIRHGELLVGDTRVTALASRYGTPVFLYDRGILDRKLDSLVHTLPSLFSICYSVKANPASPVLTHLVSRGCGLEIASGGEFQRAVRAGCDPSQVLFAGPGKTEKELELVLEHNIGEIHIESEAEAHRVSAIARRRKSRANVALRVNPVGEGEGGAMRMGGRPSPFGVDEELLEELLPRLLDEPALNFRGIHMFAGTQILDAGVLVDQYRHGIAIARKSAKLFGRPLHTVDFGGGLGIPYFAQERALDLEKLRAELAVLFAEIESDPDFSDTRFIIEPGRFLAGEAGIYLARVLDIKVSRGKKFLILDGGMNHHLAASGNLGQTIKRNYPVALVNKLNLTELEPVDVVGPLCTPLDTLARGVMLPRAEIGDLLAIFQSGAYGLSASPVHFLSHPAPAEVWIDAGRHHLIPQLNSDGASQELFVGQPSRVSSVQN